MKPTDQKKISVAVCQMTSTEDIDTNKSCLLRLLSDSVSAGAEFVSFPENSLYMRINEKGPYYGMPIDHPAIDSVADACAKHSVCVHLGSVPVRENDRIYNSTLLINEQGEVQRVYDKIHLFDIDLKKHKSIKESDYFTHGERVYYFDWKGFRFGTSICYDLRFSELFSVYARAEVDCLLIPAAFLVPTGKAHWQVLLRARAIECQAYVVAAAQSGEHIFDESTRRRSYGHSMIVDPWGEVSAEIESGVSFTLAELERDKIALVREQMPMKSHRRYTLFDGRNGI